MPWPRALIRFWWLPAIAILLAIRACVATPPRAHLAADGTGSLFIPIAGPAVIGFQSPSPATLHVNNETIAGANLQTKWTIVPAGPIAIQFTGPPDARLIWSPVGRRGDFEYIPASSLSPDPPATATFDHPGTTISDGIVALAILLVIIAASLLAARDRLRLVSKQTWLAMAAIFVAAVVIRWIGLSDHGQTWDEEVNMAAGKNYITNLLSLDFRPAAWQWNFEHPPIMKYLEGIGAQFADGFGPSRALSAIWISIGCMLLVPIGTALYSRPVGIIAAAFAALLPPLIAHGQIVGHESPTVLWWALGILLSLHAETRRHLITIGIVIGLATASRFVNGLLGPLCLAIIFIRKRTLIIPAALMMPPIALATIYVVWPKLWFHPIASLQQSFGKLSNLHSTEPFLGVMTKTPGPHYFLLYLFATLPIVMVALVIAYLVRTAIRRERSAWIVLAWFVIPMGVVFSPVRQDGVRYVMPCVLAFALIAAAGLDFVAGRFRKPAAAAVILYLAITAFRIRPYYLDYFGEQVGAAGTVSEHRWFETAWWGEGLDRAVDYVNTNASPNAKVYRGCIEMAHLAWFRADLFKALPTSITDADWVVAYAPKTNTCPIPRGFTNVYSVDANGATLVEVWKR
ncbi:MAG: glycosyltransferase family 39 protein [Kofleriaceae bacterium]